MIISRSSALSSTWRAGRPSSSASLMRRRMASSTFASLLPDFAIFASFMMRFSTISRSARQSSVWMMSMSRSGSMLPSTCVMFVSSKQRTTCATASTWRMCSRNLLPRPSPFDAPFTRPAMSTKRTDAGVVFFDWYISCSTPRRGSGTPTTPTFGSIVQNGKFAASAPAFVIALKSVLLPTFGRPTIPTSKLLNVYSTFRKIFAFPFILVEGRRFCNTQKHLPPRDRCAVSLADDERHENEVFRL